LNLELQLETLNFEHQKSRGKVRKLNAGHRFFLPFRPAVCYPPIIVRKFLWIFSLAILALLIGSARADTFKLVNGDTVTGELLVGSANDQGVQVKVGEGDYNRVPWANFSQDDLKKFRQNKKLELLVEPFIEITQEDKKAKSDSGPLKPPPRIERPPHQSLIGAMFGSDLGLFIVLLLYAANIYSAYEVAIFRAQPPAMVCGLAAILPIAAQIIFLSMATRMQPGAETWDTGAEGAAAAGAGAPAPGTPAPVATDDAVNPMQAEGAAHPTGLKLHTEAAPEPTAAALPAPVVFQRGQFTFNRRFIETKFAGFFGVVKRDADKDMVLLVKSARGQYTAERISRIAANDMHLQVRRGHATEEVMVPFQEVQEIRLQHKDTP
jgi:hypothetical protein